MPPGNTIHAIEFLEAQEPDLSPTSICVVFGNEPFLKRHTLLRLRKLIAGEAEGGLASSILEGSEATISEVAAELATRSLFGPGKRLVIVESADSFVTRYRADLERFLTRPTSANVLVLEVTSWLSNTRLFKLVDAKGLQVECTAPTGTRLTRWLCRWAKTAHGAKLSQSVAELLVEMVGPELGLLDQELAKLALSVGPTREITPELVARMVGTWRAKTAWEMLDAALDGKPAQALMQLDRLILAGEHPVAILGQIAATLRRFAAATRVVLRTEGLGKKISVRTALEQAGIKPFVLDKAERQLRRLGRHRGARLYRWLVEADLALKGDSALSGRAVLERLLVRLATDPRSPVRPSNP